MNPKNILEFCLSPDLGGLELFVLSCYKNFRENSDCKIMIAKDKKLDKHLGDMEKFYLKRNKLFPLFPAFKLAKFIDKHEIDIVHFHWTKDIITVVLAKILSKRKPKIVQTRNMSMTRFKDDIYHRWLYKNINTIHAVTYQVKEQLKKFIPTEIRPTIEVVYMGTKESEIDTQRVEELKKHYNLEGSFVVGIVGRIEEAKGQYLIIEAVSKLKEMDIKALIVGDSMDKSYIDELKTKIEDLDIEDRVIFSGFTKEVDTYMQLFDVNILATPKETFGLVVIEAMINRVCMIATNKAGPLEIIDNGQNGLLFDRTSYDLASKISLLYNDKALKEKLALEGYKKAKEMFDLDIQLNKLLGVIEK